eukprot:GHVQ01016325.1.p1 GENE.GHVQ01016325.1~~GHVQ01016325.1.p1  ORF type:complete len:241 (-),score=11.43 GHVQ01016325.1:235-957(-)
MMPASSQLEADCLSDSTFTLGDNILRLHFTGLTTVAVILARTPPYCPLLGLLIQHVECLSNIPHTRSKMGDDTLALHCLRVSLPFSSISASARDSSTPGAISSFTVAHNIGQSTVLHSFLSSDATRGIRNKSRNHNTQSNMKSFNTQTPVWQTVSNTTHCNETHESVTTIPKSAANFSVRIHNQAPVSATAFIHIPLTVMWTLSRYGRPSCQSFCKALSFPPPSVSNSTSSTSNVLSTSL